ncbi:MAG: hypothetical protein H0X29_11815 [Parachlamydiaceae bacterium]|nr:hypothetical protein [Parachlamydiaceae bacterium]
MTTFTTNVPEASIGAARAYPEPQPANAISGVIRGKINDFAYKASSLASEILGPKPTSFEVPNSAHEHYHYHDSSSWMPWYYSRPTTVIVSDRNTSCNTSNRRNSEKNDGGVALAVAATGIALGGLYYVATNLNALWDAESKLNEIKCFNNDLDTFSKIMQPQEELIITEAKQTASLTERICKRTKDSELIGLYLKSGVVASCTSYVAGYCSTLPAIQAIAIGTGLLCTGSLIFKYGIESSTGESIRDAQALNNSIAKLRTL